jgi:cell division protein FtsI (penicillin-binding protein 3)/stage V sporulation protein D (sporulation-specific penicillin-binding protein)
VAVKGEYSKERMVASFIGFWPYDSPKYTLLVVLGEPGQGRYYGGAIAAPVFKAIVEDIERLNSGE